MTDVDAAGRHGGRIAGIDFGTVRVGVAITDPARTLASPYQSFVRSGPAGDARWFRGFAEDEDIRLFVVGLPVHMSGQESAKSREARQFGQWLHEVTGREVVFFDERYTTVEAERVLQQAHLTSKRRKKRRDMLAAQVMLAAYLESSSSRVAEPRALD